MCEERNKRRNAAFASFANVARSRQRDGMAQPRRARYAPSLQVQRHPRCRTQRSLGGGVDCSGALCGPAPPSRFSGLVVSVNGRKPSCSITASSLSPVGSAGSAAASRSSDGDSELSDTSTSVTALAFVALPLPAAQTARPADAKSITATKRTRRMERFRDMQSNSADGVGLSV